MENNQDQKPVKGTGDLNRRLNEDVIVVRNDIAEKPAAGVIILPKTPLSPEPPAKTDD